MFDVLTCGFAPARLRAHPAHTGVGVLPAPTDGDFLDAGYERIRGATERPTLLVHPAAPAARRRVAVLRATLRGVPLFSAGFARPLTGLAGVATWLASLAAADVPVAVAVGDTLEHHPVLLPTYAVTTSVAGLDLPVVRLNHHMLSWLPGTTFSVALDQQPRVTTGRLDREERPGRGAVDLVVAGSRALRDRLSGVTPGMLGERAPATGGGPGTHWWGRARFFEQTLVPQDVGAHTAAIDRGSVRRCPDCGEPTLAACPFCTAREGQLA